MSRRNVRFRQLRKSDSNGSSATASNFASVDASKAQIRTWSAQPRSVEFNVSFLFGAIAVLTASIVVIGLFIRFVTLPARIDAAARYQVVMRSPHGISTKFVRYEKYRTLEKLLSTSNEIMTHPNANARKMWPPTIWVMRIDCDSDQLERRIDIDCAGTLDEPKITPGFRLNSGDRVFVDFGV